ncbi:MAG: glycoside hydrolase family 26 protein [Breznakibacter sp.]
MILKEHLARAMGICLLSAISLTGCQPPPPSMASPSDKSATRETRALYRNLFTISEPGIMFGHQDATLYGIGWKYDKEQSDVRKVTGDYPAVYGWEIGHIETGDSVSLDSMHFTRIREEAIKAYKRGGLNTISWHLNNPLTGGSSWDVSNNQTVASILPNGENHALYMEWLDRLADYLNSFEDEKGTKTPLLFRPFHEHSGSWFWWGKELCTPDQYKELYRFTIDHLRKARKVNHLLIIYSPDRVYSEAEYFERYPGDEYVDILGIDWYHKPEMDSPESFVSDVSKALLMVKQAAAAKNKPFVFSETGLEALPIADWFTKILYPAISTTKPAYVLVWRNAHERPNHFFAPYPGHPACEDFKAFKEKKEIHFESELPNLYQ